ncbi:MAG TPA: protein kinase [Pyrinomonadaceae bacterium]|jgi:serine/threonine-protein kinase|nr:protein kinase [Pyrinomonadaceae bacterium]
MSQKGFQYCPRCGSLIPDDSPLFVCAACGYDSPQEEGFPAKVAREIVSVMQREMFTPPGGPTFIPPEYVVYLSNDDDKEWQGGKRRGLELVLYHILSESARELADYTQLATKSFAVDLRVDGTLVKGELRVQPLWDSSEAGGHTGVTPSSKADASDPKEPLAWKNANTSMVFETMIEPRGAPLPPPVPRASAAQKGIKPPARRDEADGYSDGQCASMAGSPRGRRLPVPALVEGTIIAGRYEVKRRLGSGGFANIYLVTDADDYLQEEIVLKLVDEDLMRELLSQESEGEFFTHDDLIRAWRSKLKVWKVISEQEPAHIVRLLGVPRIIFEQESSYSVGMLMEYMPDGDLWQYFRKHGAPRSREQLTGMMRLFLSACRAVGVLHENGLIHRDIKPSNFLLAPGETQCKLSDFELIIEADERAGGAVRRATVGTPIYMAPECMEARYSFQSDIYALGAMLYHLLTGENPRPPTLVNPPADDLRSRPLVEPSRLNPLVTAELSEAVLRCLDDDPAARPSSVAELTDELTRLGLTGDAVNIAPVNLARLLLTHLPSDEVRDLVESLEEGGFHSASAETEQRQKDIMEEYCYTASPYDVLKENCTTRQLRALTESLGLAGLSGAVRDDLIEEILTSVGFLASAREVPGIEASRTFLENLRLNLAHATTMDECVGMIQAGLSAVERTVELLLSFYGQLLLGTKFPAFLKKAASGKPPERLTFGQKLGALRQLCLDAPAATLPIRTRKVFKFPLISAEVFERLSEVVRQRNLYAHSPQESTRRSLALAQRSGRQLLEHAVTSLNELAQNTNVPRVVQIVSRQDDIYGRHFYLGRDDRGRSERIFTPLPLNVGRLYLFFPLTNPARINPLIYPFDSQGQGR